jgi:hypothetical protein
MKAREVRNATERHTQSLLLLRGGGQPAGDLFIAAREKGGVANRRQKALAEGAAAHGRECLLEQGENRVLLARSNHIELLEGVVSECSGLLWRPAPWSMEMVHGSWKVIFHKEKKGSEGTLCARSCHKAEGFAERKKCTGLEAAAKEVFTHNRFLKRTLLEGRGLTKMEKGSRDA